MSSTLTPAVPQVVFTPSSEIVDAKRNEAHSHRRRFIGPLPEDLLSQVIDVVESHPRRRGWFGFSSRRQHTQHTRNEQSESSDSDTESEHSEQGIRDAIREHAREFFLGHGGRTEDWHEDTERHVREEMWRLWRESQWGKLRAQRKAAAKSASMKRWVGSSFDIGVFLGVDLLGGASSISAAPSTVQAQVQPVTPSTAAGESFFTARSEVETHATPSGHDQTAPHPTHIGFSIASHHDDPDSSVSSPVLEHAPTPAQSDTALVSIPPPMQNVPSVAQSNSAALTKPHDTGKRKTVHYDIPEDDESGELPPASPGEVLRRTGDEVQGTSAGAAQQATRENQVKWGDVIMRDRMLVRVSHTGLDSIGSNFDENQNRVTPHIHNQNWKEYIVAWRKDRLELYRDHATPGKEWLTGHKHLAYMIPLDNRTRLSLYSFVDLTFCITCPAKPIRARSKRRFLLGAASGTSMFIFKVKSRTRAMDWTWHLWRHLGGQIPSYIEIKAPFLDTRFKIDIPSWNSGNISKAYGTFTRENIIGLCERGLRDIPAYKALIEENRDKGIEFELAWRVDTYLDWVVEAFVEEDVEGKGREWAVLGGLALKQANKPNHLELRVHRHRPTRVHLKDGTRLDEPSAIEGYLDRIRPNTQSRQSFYLATHDGWVFTIPPLHAQPPMPPGAPTSDDANPANPFETAPGLSLQEAEVRRGRRQILRATEMTDLRSVVMVRRAFQVLPPIHEPGFASMGQNHNLDYHSDRGDGFGLYEGGVGGENGNGAFKRDPEDTAEFWESPERTEMDDQDPGGPEVLAKSTGAEKGAWRMRRSFELVLSTGRVVRYEAHSCSDALEWITRLRPLVSYWRKRHRVDARVEMDLAYESGGQRITPPTFTHVSEKPTEKFPDKDPSLPELSAFYNWCILDDCRPILKCGRVFWRKGRKGMYRQLQLVLVSGHLIQFQVTGKSSLHHRKHRVVNLLDAYVVSGFFAAQHLPIGQYHPDNPPLARRYRDGLESDENEEDTLFMIWYRKNAPEEESTSAPAQPASTAISNLNVHKEGEEGGKQKLADVPPLHAKRKLGVFRTRSKLERDAWVWAINVEIDKTVRRMREREGRVRQAGELMKT